MTVLTAEVRGWVWGRSGEQLRSAGMGWAEAVVVVGAGSLCTSGRLTSLVHEELVEMVHLFQAGALSSLVWVLAQNPQHAHQLPNSF